MATLNAIKRIFGGIVDFVTGVFTGDWSRAWQGVVDIFGGIFEGIAAKAPINDYVNQWIYWWIKQYKIPKWVPGIGGKGFHIENPLFSRRWNYSKWPPLLVKLVLNY